MSERYITETVHGEPVKGGEVEGKIDGKSTKIDIKTLRKQIPAHCFQPSTLRSLSWVVHDVAIFVAIAAATFHLDPLLSNWGSLLLRLVVYPYLAGLPLTGLWVLAHECGHGAFSTNKIVANTVGYGIHSALLTPYFSWRSSHGRHHQFANNIATDLNYVPPTRGEYRELFRGEVKVEPDHEDHAAEDAPLVVMLRIILQQIIGWPWYLLTHITAGPDSSPKQSMGWWDNSHFVPSSSLFRENEFWDIALTDAGLVAMAYALYLGGQYYGPATVLWVYVLPWMWVNHWIVMITYLHHTSPSLPKYTPDSWTYMRGALATVDRNPGWVLRYMFHHIIDRHVIHHLFPRLPHYHAVEATDAIKPVLGPQYHVDNGSYWGALWTAFTQCQWVEADGAKTQDAEIYTSPGSAADTKSSASNPDEHGILWYRPGPMPGPATIMRS